MYSGNRPLQGVRDCIITRPRADHRPARTVRDDTDLPEAAVEILIRGTVCDHVLIADFIRDRKRDLFDYPREIPGKTALPPDALARASMARFALLAERFILLAQQPDEIEQHFGFVRFLHELLERDRSGWRYRRRR